MEWLDLDEHLGIEGLLAGRRSEAACPSPCSDASPNGGRPGGGPLPGHAHAAAQSGGSTGLPKARRGNLAMVVETALVAVQNYLRVLQTYGLPVRFGVVFGSQATGQANPWSDIDLLVVSPQFDGRRERRDVDLLWRLAARTDSRIEPVPCGEHQ
jgi:hypothetical protein